MVKVMPSAVGADCWNVKSLVKEVTLTGVLKNALPASSSAVVSVSRRRVPRRQPCLSQPSLPMPVIRTSRPLFLPHGARVGVRDEPALAR